MNMIAVSSESVKICRFFSEYIDGKQYFEVCLRFGGKEFTARSLDRVKVFDLALNGAIGMEKSLLSRSLIQCSDNRFKVTIFADSGCPKVCDAISQSLEKAILVALVKCYSRKIDFDLRVS